MAKDTGTVVVGGGQPRRECGVGIFIHETLPLIILETIASKVKEKINDSNTHPDRFKQDELGIFIG